MPRPPGRWRGDGIWKRMQRPVPWASLFGAGSRAEGLVSPLRGASLSVGLKALPFCHGSSLNGRWTGKTSGIFRFGTGRDTFGYRGQPGEEGD